MQVSHIAKLMLIHGKRYLVRDKNLRCLSEMNKIIADILMPDASWGSCLPDYRLKPLRFHPLVRRERHTQTVAKGWDVAGYKGWRVRIESARFRENEIRLMRERLRTESVLCARVCRGWKRGAEVQGTRGNGEKFSMVSRVSAGKSPIPPFAAGGTNNTRISREGGFMMSDRGN